jgi:acid phosphatase (class A)
MRVAHKGALGVTTLQERLRRIALTLTSVLSIAGSGLADEMQPVPEIRPGFLKGYLPREALPDSAALLPPPPAVGSASAELDQEVARASLALRDTPRWTLAALDAKLEFPDAAGAFACALGVGITEQDTPRLYTMLRRILTDAGLATYAAKDKYQHARPFMLDSQPICTPDREKTLRGNGSYPSGHTSAGWAWALVLAEASPEQSEAIFARGLAFGESRIVCNVHWASDVIEGRTIGAATVARLHAEPDFLADLAAARAEIAAARTKGLPPQRDCKFEAEALELAVPDAP